MYSYEKEKPKILTDDGQRYFLSVRDFVQKCLKQGGAVIMSKAMSPPGGSGICDSWGKMACVDRLVELGEIREVSQHGCAGQHRLFVSARG